MPAPEPLSKSEADKIIAHAAEVSADAAAKEAPKLTMPALEKGPAHFYDTETGAFWLGIPLDKTDPLMALAVLDRVKMDILGIYAAMSQKQKIVKPGAGARVSQLLSGVAARFRK